MKIGDILYHELLGKLVVSKKQYRRLGNKTIFLAVDEDGKEHELDGTEIPYAEYELKDKKKQKESQSVDKIISKIEAFKGDPGSDADEDFIIQAVIPQVLERIRLPKDGKDGADADTELIIREMLPLVMNKMPKPEKINEASIISKILSRIRIPQDGKDGAKGKDGSPDTPTEIKEKLESLKGEERLDASAIKNLPKQPISIGGGGVVALKNLQEVNITNPTDNQSLTYDSATGKWVNETITGGSGGHTIQDEGTPLTSRTNLNFVGANVNVTDDAGNDATVVTISGGGSGTVETIVEGTNIDVDATDPANPIVSLSLGADDNFVTDAEKTKLSNLSGTNTGDQDLSPYFNKSTDDLDDITAGTTNKHFTDTEKTKLAGIETAADVTDATNVAAAGAFMKSVDDTDDITVGATNKFATAAEKTKLGHITVTQAVDLDAIESASHAAVTVADSAEIDFTLTGQQISAAIVASSIDESKLDASVNASLDLADSSVQPGDNITDLDATAHRVFYSDGSGDIQELALGADGTFLKSNGAAVAPSFATPAGSGDVSKVGTPVNNQIGVWTGDGTIEGDAALTYDGTSFNLATGKNFQIAGSTVLADAAGTTTLSNIDALDGTTESTIEAAIDTLANLTSVQGRTVTLADAGANAFFGWDDTAGAYENLTAAEAEAIIEPLIDTLANLTSVQGLTVTLADAGADALLGWDDSAAAYQNLSAADARTALGLTANGQSLVTAANYAAMRTLLDLEAGTDFYSIAAADTLLSGKVGTTGNETIAGTKTFSSDVLVPDEAYDATAWNGSLEVPTKNAVRDKIEAMLGSSGITRTVVVTSGSATMGSSASTDYAYFVAGAHTMSLPAASGNTNRYTVKNNHSANITIDTAGAETVEGAASISIAPQESVDLMSNGTNWFVI